MLVYQKYFATGCVHSSSPHFISLRFLSCQDATQYFVNLHLQKYSVTVLSNGRLPQKSMKRWGVETINGEKPKNDWLRMGTRNGERLHNYGKLLFFMGQRSISMGQASKSQTVITRGYHYSLLLSIFDHY